jgi:integrase
MMMRLRYVKLIKGNYYFQKAVPEKLQDKFGCKVIQKRLDGTLEEIRDQALAWNEQYRKEFTLEKTDAVVVPAPSMSVLARELLHADNWKIDLGPSGVSPDGLSKDDLIEQTIHLLAQEGNAVAAKAIELARDPQACTITEAVEIWLEWKASEVTKKNEAYIRRSVRYLTECVGDKPLTLYTRADTKTYVDYLLARGMVSSSVKRNLQNLETVVNRARNQRGLDMTNVFAGYSLPRLNDTKTVLPYSAEDLEKLKRVGLERDSHVSLLMLLQLNIGARIGELAGLDNADLKLGDNIPHVVIEPRPWRRLKTARSSRRVPLLGISLIAAQQLQREYGGDNGTPLFSQYNRKGETNANSASAAVNKITKAHTTNKLSSHSARHRVNNDLIKVGCPIDIRYSITGHTFSDSNSANYSKEDLPLDVKLKWLEEIAV